MEIIAIILASVALLLTICGKREPETRFPNDIPRCANCTDYVEGILEGKEELQEEIINRLMEQKTRTNSVEHGMVADILDMVRGAVK